MKLYDLRLRGSGFTLGTIVNDKDHDMFRELIDYWQQKDTNQDALVPIQFKLHEFNPPSEFNINYTEERIAILSDWLIKEGYATKKDDTFCLTWKTIEVLEKTIAKDRELSESGFYCCPCRGFC